MFDVCGVRLPLLGLGGFGEDYCAQDSCFSVTEDLTHVVLVGY